MQSAYDDKYRDYNPDSFVIKARRTVYKWWCVVYKPVYKLTHDGRWPQEKEPYNVYPTRAMMTDVADMAAQAVAAVEAVEDADSAARDESCTQKGAAAGMQADEPEIDLSGVDENTLDKANEIMARLAKEAAEDEAKKQKEIDVAKKKAREKEKLDSIMLANKVDIAPFIEEGRASRAE
jgi:hypothetical protein